MSGKKILSSTTLFRKAVVCEIAKRLKMTPEDTAIFLVSKVCTPEGRKELSALLSSL